MGALRMPEAPSSRMYGTPTKSDTTVIVHGIGKAFWHFLFVMLYMTLRKNHAKKQTPRRAVRAHDMGTLISPASHFTSVHSSMASSSTHTSWTGSAAFSVAASSAIMRRPTGTLTGAAKAGRRSAGAAARAIGAPARNAAAGDASARRRILRDDMTDFLSGWCWLRRE